ncbi:hypothetical protein [Kitasatospora sp. KL5]|uniref:hypothetical protein n=1 Tax=Kitasatospora sp. KL5 TaxID=3425125 RepID=UPI003D6DDC07
MALHGKSVADRADQVLPAPTAAMALLNQRDPAEADNFRNTVLVALDAVGTAARNSRLAR